MMMTMTMTLHLWVIEIGLGIIEAERMLVSARVKYLARGKIKVN